MDAATPLEPDPALSLYSLLSFVVFAMVVTGCVVLWSRGKPAVPLALLTAAMLFCLVASPQFAIVPAILLAAMIVAIWIRRPDTQTE